MLINNGHTVVRYLAGRSIVVKEAGQVLSKAERSTRYRFTGNKRIQMEKSSVLRSKITSRYLFISLLQAALENFSQLSERCGRINIEMKIENS